MSRLVLKMSMSLDGYVAGPGAWNTAGRSADSGAWLLDTLQGASAQLIGATTYESWRDFWPAQTGPVADVVNTSPKIVFSKTLTATPWGPATVEAGDLVETVTRLKQESAGGYLLAQAGVRFCRSLVATGLVDEYRLVVHPVVLGGGERLFEAPLALSPTSTTAFSGGIVAHVFSAGS